MHSLEVFTLEVRILRVEVGVVWLVYPTKRKFRTEVVKSSTHLGEVGAKATMTLTLGGCVGRSEQHMSAKVHER